MSITSGAALRALQETMNIRNDIKPNVIYSFKLPEGMSWEDCVPYIGMDKPASVNPDSSDSVDKFHHVSAGSIPLDRLVSYDEGTTYSHVSEPWGYQDVPHYPDLPKREGVNYVSSIDELRENDLILTVDYEYNESVERVKCVDMGIWTESVVDGEELFETREEFSNYRFVILLNRK
jgi:hypothetical protein